MQYAQLNMHCLREDSALQVHPPAHWSQPLSYSAEALPSGFRSKLPAYTVGVISGAQHGGFFFCIEVSRVNLPL